MHFFLSIPDLYILKFINNLSVFCFFADHFIWRQFPPVDNSTIVINKVIVIKSFFRIQTLLSTGHVINTKLNEVKMATIFFTNTSRGKGFENSINLRGF